MHLYFERNVNAKCDCTILSLSWMGKVPDELSEEDIWKLNRNNYYLEGWLATGNLRGIVGVTYTSTHLQLPHELPLRTNYNLRGHRHNVILVKWNEPYQKLASCDSSGVIFVWIKYEGRWSIELINDRNTPVTHFSWSHDGRMALICYQDGFVLVGSVAGQRYWSSMLSLDARITCGCWTPDDSQVYLGTASAQLVVMDAHGAMVSQVQIAGEGGITSMAWSCEKFMMEEGEEAEAGHVLALALGSGELVLLRGHDDVSPARVRSGLRGDTLVMEWGNSRELLAVAGTLIPEGNEVPDAPPYKNVVKFYSDTGALIYTIPIPYTQARVSALTWGHSARRLFVACGGAVATARVYRMVAPLQLLARVRAAQFLPHQRAAAHLPLPPTLQPLLLKYFRHTIRCNVPSPELVRRFVSRPPVAPARAYCTMLRHDDDEAAAFTLYLEHLGGLIPLLKGRRTSKIRPEFVIFDPQCEDAEMVLSCGEMARESSSSSSSSGGGAGGGGYTLAGSPRRAHVTHSPGPTDSSDSEREEGCSGSPRLQRKRRTRARRKYEKMRNTSDKEDVDELTYIDSLPENLRLVEVTSNIWGTKFKIHGLAKDVPANLGQVTYKTSLLHLQPRQMTLVITDLSEDEPVAPDPNFNPNIFSEDEEDVFQVNNSPTHSNNNVRRNNERLNNINNTIIQSDINSSITNINNNNINTNPSLARAESYEEFPFIDTSETINHVSENVYSAPVRHTSQPTERRVNNPSSAPNRHAISPLRCDGSVPTLQSPKNAVAPTDIIFERPSPQTVACGGRGDFCGGRAEYGVRSDNVNFKGNLEQQSFSLNLSLEPARQVMIKKCDNHVTETCLSKLRKNICSRGESTTYETRVIKSIPKTYESEVHMDSLSKTKTLKNLQKNDELKYIDEETPVDVTINNLTEKAKEIRPSRTAAPISPVCGNVPVYAAMTRSCSVGFLDLVDPAAVSVAALREPPRRLVLVHHPRNHRARDRRHEPPAAEAPHSHNLNRCGKSKSLDSSELSCGKEEPKEERGKEREEAVTYSTAAPERACSTPAQAPAPVPAPAQPPAPRESDYTKYYSSLEQLALRLLASRGRSRGSGGEDAGACAARESSSAPASPRPARSQPASPAPAHRPRRHRYSSASPIRQLLNSPLLNRRRHKRLSESSDEESSNGYSEVTNRDYRDLESFQKAQLRNKLKRAGTTCPSGAGAGGGAACTLASAGGGASHDRRQLVMHNKAPIWNETSQVYQLDFGGRVTQESAKNFQIEYLGRQVMQFGRIDGNAYTLDFQYPFSALQAFSVALANVTQRLK